MIAVALAALAVATAAIGATIAWALAERGTGSARVELERERGTRRVAEYERDEALGDVERLQRVSDALEEFARDLINRMVAGGVDVNVDGFDLLLAELSIAAAPRGRPHAAPADPVPVQPAGGADAAGRGGDGPPGSNGVPARGQA